MKFHQTFCFSLLIWILPFFGLTLGGIFYAIRIDVQEAYKKFAQDEFDKSFVQIEAQLLKEQFINDAHHGLTPDIARQSIQNSFDKICLQSFKANNIHGMLFFRSPQPAFWNGEAWVFERALNNLLGVEVCYQQILRFEHFEKIRVKGRYILLVFLIVLGFAGSILMILIAKRLTKPLNLLRQGSLRVANGDFAFSLPVLRSDEIGILTESFNQMVKDLALKSKYRTLLDQLTDEAVAKKLLEGEISLVGEKRQVTVLFCDVRGFTNLSETLPPEDLIKILNEHMGMLSEIAHQFHGVVDKFIGDAIMVIFGTPQHYENDALNAIEAASIMLKKRNEMNAEAKCPLNIGIGIASGIAVAGCLGSKERLNYTVIGEVVNRAARLCSKSSAKEVLLDESTQSKIHNRFCTKSLGDIQLKGIEKPICVFSLALE